MRTGMIAVGLMVWAAGAHAQVFIGMGIPAGQPRSHAVDLSVDGTTVVGDSSLPDQSGGAAWRWRMATGYQSLGGGLAAVTRTNDNGDAVVGYGLMGPAFYWRAGQPTITPGTSAYNLQPGLGVSGDGLTVIGNSNGGGYRAAKWTQAGGVVQLPYAPSTPTILVTNNGNSFAFAVNQDGSVVAGGQTFRYNTDSIITERIGVTRWTTAGSQLLLTAAGVPLEGGVYDMSSDGNSLLVVASNVYYRWTPGGGFQTAPGLPYFPDFAVPRMSGDGSTIISYDKMWTQSRGAIPITQVLTESGATFTGWTNLVATGIDMNASHLCGYGTNPMGQTEAWYATIPAPGVGGVVAIAIACMPRRSRRA